MDPQTAWVRAQLMRGVARQLSTMMMLCAMSTGLVLHFSLGTAPAASLLGGLGVAGAAGTGWLACSLFTNPLDLRYLRSYLTESVEVVDQLELTTGAAMPAKPGAAELCYTLVDDTAARPLYDVFRAGPMVIGRSRTSEAVVFYTCLTDGRTVCTDRQTSLPTEGWIMNTVRSDDAEVRLRAHLRLVHHLIGCGSAIVPSPDPRVVLRHLEAERETYRQLGPALGCYLDVDGERSLLRLAVGLDPDEVLDLGGVPARPPSAGLVRRLRVAPASV